MSYWIGWTTAKWITLRTADEWLSLTGDQRTAWWEFAADHPIVRWNGYTSVLNGWLMFNYVNCQLAVAAYPNLVMDPPTNLDLPDLIEIPVTLWRTKCKLASGDSRYHGRLLVNMETPVPADKVIIFYQNFEKYRVPYYIPPSTQRVRTRNNQTTRAGVLLPGFTGQYDLATKGGMNISRGGKSDEIQGNWARSHIYDPIGRYRVVSTVNGMYREGKLLLQ